MLTKLRNRLTIFKCLFTVVVVTIQITLSDTFILSRSHLSVFTFIQASYWMWTGDISPHDIWNITREEVIFQVRLVTEMIKQHAKVPVFPVIGNHEGVPVNR